MRPDAGEVHVAGRAVTRLGSVELAEVRRRRPALVLLPDEPYVFAEKHARELEGEGLDALFVLICGKDLSWYGPRTPVAIEQIARVARRAAK